MVSLAAISLLAGVAYGYLKSGREEKKTLLKKGALIGVALGAVLSILSFFLGWGLVFATARALGVIIAIVYLTAIFVVGTIVGDWLEAKFKKA